MKNEIINDFRAANNDLLVLTLKGKVKSLEKTILKLKKMAAGTKRVIIDDQNDDPADSDSERSQSFNESN